jgi:tripartite-type tricarboxylate transporter receptor subunit TctC
VGTHVINGATYALQYDLLKDFEPISLIAGSSWLIVAKKTLPARELTGLIDWLKANPDKASQGTVGAGSPHHVAGVFFQKETGTRFQFVPYRGAAPAVQALVAGQIDLIMDSPAITMPQVRAGTIKAYAVAAKSLLAIAPDIPTVDEAGLPGFYVSGWNALWAPRGTPKDIIAKLNSSVVNGLADRTVLSRLADLGMEVFPREQQTPEALQAHQKAEIEKWWPIIKEAGIKAE